jgi:hypothetical protein
VWWKPVYAGVAARTASAIVWDYAGGPATDFNAEPTLISSDHSPLGRLLDARFRMSIAAAYPVIAAATQRRHAASVRTPLARMLPRVMAVGVCIGVELEYCAIGKQYSDYYQRKEKH